MNRYSNDKVLKISLMIIGGTFIFLLIMCLGIGGFLLSDDSQNTKTENKIVTKDKIKKKNNKNKANLSKDKVKNKSTLSHEDKIKKNKSTKKNITQKPITKPTKSTKKIDNIEVQLAILKENFGGIANIKYKKEIKTIEILPIDKSFMIEVMQAYNGDSTKLAVWEELKENIKLISTKIENKEIMLVIPNNLNKENYILIVNNGIVLYDFVKE